MKTLIAIKTYFLSLVRKLGQRKGSDDIQKGIALAD